MKAWFRDMKAWFRDMKAWFRDMKAWFRNMKAWFRNMKVWLGILLTKTTQITYDQCVLFFILFITLGGH